MKDSPPSQPPIAVVGVSALFPGSSGADRFWNNIVEGRDLIAEVPPTHWRIEDYYDPDPAAPDKTYCKRGAFLSPEAFDALEFGIPPSSIPATDTSQLLALIVARQALEDAAVQFGRIDRDRISVILGVASGTELLGHMVSRLQRPIWKKGMRDSGLPEEAIEAACDRIANQFVPWQESTFPGLLGNVVAGRIANRLDLGGTNAVVDAACASSLAAVSMAVNELYLGQSDLALVGGVDTVNDILMYMCFSKTPALSPTGDCRPFSDRADGTMLGEGMAMLALRRLEDAERDGDSIYAVLKGVGKSSDGKSKSVYAPVAEGQAKALRRAYQAAGYGPETVELLEAHGTGTVAGDVAEFMGLKSVFDESGRTDPQWCALGSVKSQIGHTKAAAGAAGLFKAVMALHHRVLPPTIKIERPNPKLGLPKSPFYLNTRSRPWLGNSGHPRRASVSSFGFGGSNFHVALEEYRGAMRPGRFRPNVAELFLFSGNTAIEVASSCGNFAAKIEDDRYLPHFSNESISHFDRSQEARLAVVASDRADLAAKLERAGAKLKVGGASFDDPSGIYFQSGTPTPEVAFLFPGQGSQYPFMGAHLANAFELAREVWDLAGVGLAERVFPKAGFGESAAAGQEARLTVTEWAQPAIGATSLALLRLLGRLGIRAKCAGGHSFGELTALHAAGVLDERDFLRAASERGRLMAAAAVIPGAMTAVNASMDDIQTWISAAALEVTIANANEPRQTVVSGPVKAIEEFEAFLSDKNVAFKRLRVSTAFHSPIVAGASGAFLDFLQGLPFKPAVIDVYSNSDAAPYSFENIAKCREQLAAQLARPVLFVDQVRKMHEAGARIFVEVGPGSTLKQMTQKCLEGKPVQAIALDQRGMHGITAFYHGLARLSACGVGMDMAALFAEFKTPVAPPAKRSAATVKISGVNYGKPYPASASSPAVPVTVAIQSKGEKPMKEESAPRPPAAPPAHATPPTSSAVVSLDQGWLQVYLEIQRQTAETHQTFQRTMTESHTAYLRTMESFFAGLTGMPLPAHAPRQPFPEPVKRVAQLMPLPAKAPQIALPRAMAPAPAAFVPAAPAKPPVPARSAVDAPTAPPPNGAPQSGAYSLEDLKRRLLEVVAEKTGYPIEIIDLKMDMEADLGIDSIKRVEILSVFREATPGLAEVNAKAMAGLRTLSEILQYMESAPLPKGSFQNGSQSAADANGQHGVLESFDAAPTTVPAGLPRTRQQPVNGDGLGFAQPMQESLV